MARRHICSRSEIIYGEANCRSRGGQSVAKKIYIRFVANLQLYASTVTLRTDSTCGPRLDVANGTGQYTEGVGTRRGLIHSPSGAMADANPSIFTHHRLKVVGATLKGRGVDKMVRTAASHPPSSRRQSCAAPRDSRIE